MTSLIHSLPDRSEAKSTRPLFPSQSELSSCFQTIRAIKHFGEIHHSLFGELAERSRLTLSVISAIRHGFGPFQMPFLLNARKNGIWIRRFAVEMRLESFAKLSD
jgi:hypothetical protein